MSSDNTFHIHQLGNGLRIAVDVMASARSVAMGFLSQTGSRDEPPELAGASHFCEHMCFKGTDRRSWREITVEFDQMGSTYNAYTSKDRTFYYGWVRPEDTVSQLELLADMMRSTFPADQFELEKQVILEEIAMSDDHLEHILVDLLHKSVFGKHGLGWPVLGYRETIEAVTRDQLYGYFQRHYDPRHLILVVAGAVDPQDVFDDAERLCGDWANTDGDEYIRRPPLGVARGVACRQVDRFTQQGVALAFSAPAATDPDSEVARATATILGGANSRFYWNIIQTGLAPQAGAWWADYHDCGMLVLYGLAPAEQTEKVVDALRAEIARISADGALEHEVQRVRNRRRTALAAEGESPNHRLGQMVDDMDLRGRLRTVEERLAAVDAVTVDQIGEYLQRWSITGRGCLVGVGPRDWPRT